MVSCSSPLLHLALKFNLFIHFFLVGKLLFCMWELYKIPDMCIWKDETMSLSGVYLLAEHCYSTFCIDPSCSLQFLWNGMVTTWLFLFSHLILMWWNWNVVFTSTQMVSYNCKWEYIGRGLHYLPYKSEQCWSEWNSCIAGNGSVNHILKGLDCHSFTECQTNNRECGACSV